MITLHESNTTSFPLDNGIGVLSDAIIAYAEEELNGLFEFYMEYDSEGFLVDELKEERIIKAKAQDKLGYQLFRIYSITKNHENDNIIVNAQHITYDLADNFIEELKANRITKKQVMEMIGARAVEPHPFNVTSSNTTTVSSTNLYRTNPLQMVAGMDGSVLQIWGGQLERDNFNFILHDRRGHDDGVKVTYEKNITGLTAEFDISGLVTRIFPFVFIDATDDEPERLITVSGKYIDSPHINDYEVIRTEPIDYSNDDRIDTQDKTDAQIRQQLTNVAKDYFKETDNDKIKSTMDVAFMHLWETEEYKDVKVLELVGMGDTVTINHSKLKVDATAIVNYIKYDCIAHVNEEVKLGNVKAGLVDSVNKIDTIERKVEQAESNANQAIVSANGKNTTYYGPDEPVEGMQKGDLWFKVIDGQYHKTYRFDGIEWQLIIDMDSQEAKEEAQQARDRADDAFERANEATDKALEGIDKALEGIDKAQESFDKAQESLGIANDAFEEIEPIKTTINEQSGEITTIKESAIGMQEQITGLDGDVTTLQKSSSRLSARIEKLDIRGYNFITHLPSHWEMGYYGIDGDLPDMISGEKYPSTHLMRLERKYKLEPNTDYVLSDHPEMAEIGQEYVESNLFLHLWNDDGSYSRYLVLNFRNEDHFITFKTTSTETQFSLHVMPTKEENKLNPHMIHEVFHYKLALGTERSGWTPNLDDTGELVSDVQHFVSEFEATAESLAGRISDNEGNLTTLTATVDGLQTTVSDVQGNVSNLTQLSNAMQAQLKDVEGNVNTLTLTSKSMQSTISSLQDEVEGLEYENRNLLQYTDFSDSRSVDMWTTRDTAISIEASSIGGYNLAYVVIGSYEIGDYARIYSNGSSMTLTKGTTYTLSFYGVSSGWFNDEFSRIHIHSPIDGYIRIPTPKKTLVGQGDHNGVMRNIYKYTSTFTFSGDTTSGCRLLIGSDSYRGTGGRHWFYIGLIKIEKGTVATDWSPAPEDTDQKFSIIHQDIDSITTRVQGAEGNINTLTQTVDATVSRISSLANPNLITHDPSEWEELFLGLFQLQVKVEPNEIYTFKDYSTESIGLLSVEGEEIPSGGTYTFRSNSSGEVNIGVFDGGFLERLGTVYRFKLEKGTESTAWTAHDEDIYTQYSQLSDAINLRVVKGDVINQINIDTSGILISGKKLILDGDTTVTGQFKVRSANIISLDAGKVTVGDLVGHSLVGGSVIGGYIEQQSGSNRVEIQNGIVSHFINNELKSAMDGSGHRFYQTGDYIGFIGTAAWINDSNYKGLLFTLQNEADYMAWTFYKNATDVNPTTMLAWHKTNSKAKRSGINFYDDVSLNAGRLYVRRLMTDYINPSRAIELQNYTWNNNGGVIITRSPERGSHSAGLFMTSKRAVLKDGGNSHIEVGSNSAGNYVESIDIWNRTSSNSVNMRVSSSGKLLRVTSASKYKLLIENEEEKGFNYNKILDLNLKSWYDKNDSEKLAELEKAKEKGRLNDNIDDDFYLKRHFGLIAEDVESAGLQQFVDYDVETGEVEGIAYDRLWTLLIPITRQHQDDIEWLKIENQYLKQKVKILEEKVS